MKCSVSNSACGPGYLSQYNHSLRAGRSGDRIPVGARFYASVHTICGAHPASYTMGTGSFPGVKRPGGSVNHQPPSSTEVKERVDLRAKLLLPFWAVISDFIMNCIVPIRYVSVGWVARIITRFYLPCVWILYHSFFVLFLFSFSFFITFSLLDVSGFKQDFRRNLHMINSC
jgi:hypothetical protein